MSLEIKESLSGGDQGAAAAGGASEGGSGASAPAAAGEGAGQGQAPGAGATEGSSPAEGPAEADPAAAAPAPTFKPRDKFKVRNVDTDSQDEIDVPDWVKAAVKDPETEKQALALLEKAYGLEPVKKHREQIKTERDTFKTELTGIHSQIGDVRKTFQRGDIDGWLAKLGVPAERMLQWALDKVQYSQLPPEQQAAYDARIEAQRRAWSAEEMASHLQNTSFEQARSVKQQLLQSSLARPDIKSFAEAFNAKAGKPNAFIAEVQAIGIHEWNASQGKVDLSPDEAIGRVMDKWKPFLSVTSAAPAAMTPSQGVSAAAAGSQAGAVDPNAQANVIPNVQGKSASPLKSKPKNLEELRALQKAAASS